MKEVPFPLSEDNARRIAIIINPYFSYFIYCSYVSSFKNAPRILEPSSGGIGIKLNKPSPKFITEKYNKKL